MLTHLFKLIWNKKKQNFLLITEMFISFIVMFAVFTLIVYYYNNYKKPMGFDYDNVWVVSYTAPETINRADSVEMFHNTLKQMLRSMPQIKEVSLSSGNVPFSMNTSNSMINYGNNSALANFYGVEDSYAKLLNMHMEEGRWFTEADKVHSVEPVVINSTLKKKLFGNEMAIGKFLGQNDPNNQSTKQKVIGVVDDIKDKGDYQAIEAGLYKYIDTGWARWIGTIIIKVNPDADAAFESRLFKSLSNAIGTSIEIEHMDKKRQSKNKLALVPMIVMLIVAGFLIINVALGLFGVLWYNINRRISEIGLRRAIGATSGQVYKQFVGEVLVLAFFGIALGLLLAAQFPLLQVFGVETGVYVAAMVASVIAIFLLAAACAAYPSRQAAKIAPARALHEE
jgi:putative ABC transport system permease protein